jgi:hypothetical protein
MTAFDSSRSEIDRKVLSSLPSPKHYPSPHPVNWDLDATVRRVGPRGTSDSMDKWVSKCALLILLVENPDGRAIPLLEMTRQ